MALPTHPASWRRDIKCTKGHWQYFCNSHFPSDFLTKTNHGWSFTVGLSVSVIGLADSCLSYWPVFPLVWAYTAECFRVADMTHLLAIFRSAAVFSFNHHCLLSQRPPVTSWHWAGGWGLGRQTNCGLWLISQALVAEDTHVLTI